MIDPMASGATNAAAGWYPDGTGGQRWWTGSAWSEHTAPAVPAQALHRPALPEGVRIDTAWVWLTSLVYLLGCIPMFFLDMGDYLRAVFEAEVTGSTRGIADSLTGYVAFGMLSWLLSLALWGLTVFAAFRDHKHLQTIGVVRPFHWAFAFIPYTIVYLIGRHVVLRKVSRTVGWPLWAHIVSYVVVFMAVGIWTLVVMQQMFEAMSHYLVNFS